MTKNNTQQWNSTAVRACSGYQALSSSPVSPAPIIRSTPWAPGAEASYLPTTEQDPLNLQCYTTATSLLIQRVRDKHKYLNITCAFTSIINVPQTIYTVIIYIVSNHLHDLVILKPQITHSKVPCVVWSWNMHLQPSQCLLEFEWDNAWPHSLMAYQRKHHDHLSSSLHVSVCPLNGRENNKESKKMFEIFQ